MIPEIRKRYNAEFTPERYTAFLRDINTSTKYPVDFRISETPLFLSKQLTDELVFASDEIVHELLSKNFQKKMIDAIPAGFAVPQEDDHPLFLQIDFGLCQDQHGNIVPQLIELQGFPSLYFFQHLLDKKFRNHFAFDDGYSTYFNGLSDQSYVQILKNVILGSSAPEHVVLLEIEPERQKTRIDFACTEDVIGVRTVCMTDIIKRGRKLYYRNAGKEIPIERIYNRVIFDDLQQRNIAANFTFADDLDVIWVGHPNWFFKISKYSLPYIKSKYAPKCFFLDQLPASTDDLSSYVLKPLFSFAGSGVCVDLTKEILDSIHDRKQYLLQKKVTYAPLIATPDGFSKAEIRMMFIWQDRPLLVNNLVRMSKGAMMGVAYNREKTWVGSSLAYHP